MPLQPQTPLWDLGPQNLDWVSPSRKFATFQNLLDAQPNYEHEVAIVEATRIKYQGVAPVVGGWRLANGAPGPYPPTPDPPPTNDSFTTILLEFEGIEGSTTYVDTNAAGWPNQWGQVSGFGHITNVNEPLGEGALYLDGETVIIAPDRLDFVFGPGDFNIRFRFVADALVGFRRAVFAKSDDVPNRRMFWIDQLPTGEFEAGLGTGGGAVDLNLRDRDSIVIRDRFNEEISVRDTGEFSPSGLTHTLQSVTKYSDTLNPGAHTLVFRRTGSTLQLVMDGAVEDSEAVGVESVGYVVGPITIGGYGAPRNGQYTGPPPWKGLLDRLTVDIGTAR